MTDITKLSAIKTIQALKHKEFSSVELTKAYIQKIEANRKLNAFVTDNFESAIEQAKASDQKINDGTAGELEGLPIGIKDLFCTKGIRTTCASKMLENFVPTYESTVTQKLLDAGCVNLGKLNMDEFAMGSTTSNSIFGPSINPYKKNGSSEDLVAGGSSGGSAVAVSANLCVAATGSDTGGSVRQPASFTNLVGIKPTYGRCSRYGMVAYASSLDQAGIFAKDVKDAALFQKVISGFDEKDSTSVNLPVPQFEQLINSNIKGKTIGIPREYRVDGMDKEISSMWQKASDLLTSLGAKVVEISLPHTKYAPSTYYIIATAECSSNLARFDGVRYGFRAKGENLSLEEMYEQTRSQGFSKEVKRRILAGTYVLSAGYYDAYYKKAQKVRRLIRDDFIKAFETVDAILTPTTPTPAFPIKGVENIDPVTMYLNDIFTITANLAGIPAISMPFGFNQEGLPLGIQLMAKHFDEQSLFDIGYAIESAKKN